MSHQEFGVFALFMFGLGSTCLSFYSLKSIKTAWMLPYLTFASGWCWAFFIAAINN